MSSKHINFWKQHFIWLKISRHGAISETACGNQRLHAISCGQVMRPSKSRTCESSLLNLLIFFLRCRPTVRFWRNQYQFISTMSQMVLLERVLGYTSCTCSPFQPCPLPRLFRFYAQFFFGFITNWGLGETSSTSIPIFTVALLGGMCFFVILCRRPREFAFLFLWDCKQMSPKQLLSSSACTTGGRK